MLQEQVQTGLSAQRTVLLRRVVQPLTTLDPKTKQAWLHFIAGGTGGMIGASLTCPLDVVKTRLQSSLYKPTATMYSHAQRSLVSTVGVHVVETFGILRSIRYHEGVRGLFQGLGPSLVGVVPARAINFAAYGNGKRILVEMNGGKESSVIHLTAAATAGITTATITSPIWLVKTRMQLQAMSTTAPARYRNSLDCVGQVIRSEGIRGLYRGVSASYLGVAEGTLQWVVYEKFKSWIHERRRVRYGTEHCTENRSALDWFEYFAAAGSAKLLAAVVTYPHEVIRTRLRQGPSENGLHKYTGLRQCFGLILKEEGFAALYSGMTPHLMRTVPNAAIMFFCYEAIMHSFGAKKSE
ncbi:mitochondrial carrier [Basidiobolus meristosporus CBS 931.73]|uniref:Mitochondrial carrier n=1 Tax=Basidiobolus meristosporus CBS 931.73 TaxID=1314790 RepID=A0A1Y1WYU6_9FUNG|nr:mitochondrial carrier [Basidiobolus meristosporus CBS 931.73]|eukprot:ORX78565.1 mitochondrial carrier [Basidiobolus meristosporus CBS 931.73]